MFTRTALALSFFALSVLPVSAQTLTIHNSPQKAAYASPAEYPTIGTQCHWKDVGVNPMNMVAHTHLDLTAPIYAEWWTGPITLKWTITMYHTDGYINDFGGYAFGTPFAQSYTLDAPFTWPLRGDPNGVVAFTGTVTLDAALATARNVDDYQKPIPHGWYDVKFAVRTQYPNAAGGDQKVDTWLHLPFYSLLNPAAPEPGRESFSVGWPRISAYCEAWSDFGASVTQTYDMLPLLGPVASDSPWNFTVESFSYSSNNLLPPGTLEYRIDPDLHHDIPGTLVASFTAANSLDSTSLHLATALPNINPTGVHKQMFRYNRADASGTRELDALLVWNQGIGTNTPPPPPPPPPAPCAGLIGQAGIVTIGGANFRVTVTSEACAATVAVF